MWHVWNRRELRTEGWWGYLRERDHLKDVDVDRKIILKLALSKKHGMAWTDLICFKRRKNGGYCEHGNEPFCFVLTEKMLASEEGVGCLDGWIVVEVKIDCKILFPKPSEIKTPLRIREKIKLVNTSLGFYVAILCKR